MVGPHYTDSTSQLRLILAKLLAILIKGAMPDPPALPSTAVGQHLKFMVL